MEIQVEASPFIETKGSNKAKEELYNIPFEYYLIGNPDGAERPIKMGGFWESDNAYEDRLTDWEEQEKKVLFEGWSCKDMLHFQELRYKNVIITLETIGYEVNYAGRKFVFPLLPETIDEFINDLKRIGIKLFWKDKIADIYGIDNITSNKKIIDYFGILKDLNNT